METKPIRDTFSAILDDIADGNTVVLVESLGTDRKATPERKLYVVNNNWFVLKQSATTLAFTANEEAHRANRVVTGKLPEEDLAYYELYQELLDEFEVYLMSDDFRDLEWIYTDTDDFISTQNTYMIPINIVEDSFINVLLVFYNTLSSTKNHHMTVATLPLSLYLAHSDYRGETLALQKIVGKPEFKMLETPERDTVFLSALSLFGEEQFISYDYIHPIVDDKGILVDVEVSNNSTLNIFDAKDIKMIRHGRWEQKSKTATLITHTANLPPYDYNMLFSYLSSSSYSDFYIDLTTADKDFKLELSEDYYINTVIVSEEQTQGGLTKPLLKELFMYLIKEIILYLVVVPNTVKEDIKSSLYGVPVVCITYESNSYKLYRLEGLSQKINGTFILKQDSILTAREENQAVEMSKGLLADTQ